MDYREEYIEKVTKIKADAEEMYDRFVSEGAHEHNLKIVRDLIDDCEKSIRKMRETIDNLELNVKIIDIQNKDYIFAEYLSKNKEEAFERLK